MTQDNMMPGLTHILSFFFYHAYPLSTKFYKLSMSLRYLSVYSWTHSRKSVFDTTNYLIPHILIYKPGSNNAVNVGSGKRLTQNQQPGFCLIFYQTLFYRLSILHLFQSKDTSWLYFINQLSCLVYLHL